MERHQNGQGTNQTLNTTHMQSPTFIPISQHSQILHPTIIPMAPGQILIPPHFLGEEYQKLIAASPSKQIIEGMRAIPETMLPTSLAALTALSVGEHKGVSYITVPAHQGTNTNVKQSSSEVPSLTPVVDSSKSNGQNSDQVLYYVIQTRSKDTPISYVAYVVPKTAGFSIDSSSAGQHGFNNETADVSTEGITSKVDIEKEFKYTSLRDVLCENKTSSEVS